MTNVVNDNLTMFDAMSASTSKLGFQLLFCGKIWNFKAWEIRSKLRDPGQVGVPHLITDSRDAKRNRLGRRHHVTLTGLVGMSQLSWLLPRKQVVKNHLDWWHVFMDDISFLRLVGFASWHVGRKGQTPTSNKHALFCTFGPAFHPVWAPVFPDTLKLTVRHWVWLTNDSYTMLWTCLCLKTCDNWAFKSVGTSSFVLSTSCPHFDVFKIRICFPS